MVAVTPLLVWSEAFSLGIPQLDDDHRKLVDFINTLNTLNCGAKPETEFDAEIERLRAHLLEHFGREEKLLHAVMTEAEAAKHIAHHRDVTSNISGVAEAKDRIGDMSKTVLGAAENLSAQTHALRTQVETYFRNVAAA